MTQVSPSTLIAALEAAGEITRIRLMALLSEAELTVTELVTILGQSQPRISRHLRLLAEAELIERHREGAWAFFRLADRGAMGEVAQAIVGRLDRADPQLASDHARLAEVRRARAAQAARYFAERADDWDRIRSLHVPEERVEAALRDIVGERPMHAVLDLGTGTGRMLELIAGRAQRAVGLDQSPAMLNLARARLDHAGLRNVQLRQGDIYALPVERDGYDLVVIHQVLHYLDEPARALREAARALRPGGRLVIIDFAPHDLEFLRERHAHRRLGFSHEEIAALLEEAGLDVVEQRDLAPQDGAAEQLTVSIWVGRDPRIVTDLITAREVA
jgi:demethylmenaquinone methyltransferase/2-methoxy-6-polyprenyl-1,4-benzoquinol methylase/ArsR family transcriptional regulator